MLDIEKKAASAASSVELAAATTDTVMEPFSPAAEDHAMTDVPQELHDSFSSSVHEHVYKKKDSAVDLNEPMRIDSIHIPPPLDQQPQQSHHLHLTSISPTSSSFSSVSISNNKHILQNSSSAVNLSTKTSSAVIARFYIPKSDAKKLNEELCKTVKVRKIIQMRAREWKFRLI